MWLRSFHIRDHCTNRHENLSKAVWLCIIIRNFVCMKKKKLNSNFLSISGYISQSEVILTGCPLNSNSKNDKKWQFLVKNEKKWRNVPKNVKKTLWNQVENKLVSKHNKSGTLAYFITNNLLKCYNLCYNLCFFLLRMCDWCKR